MVDNFDTNVARRKPNTAKFRPTHPWDVSKSPVSSDYSTDVDSELSKSDAVSQPVEIKNEPEISKSVESTSSIKKKHKKNLSKAVYDSSEIQLPSPDIENTINQKHNDLSNTINIHSNFCKLDNDVSDYLFTKLSPSAQSVYLRLYRQSFGWNRNWAAESLPKLKNACNLSLQTVRKAIKELETKGCILKEFSDYHKATIYRVYLPSEIGVSNDAPLIINTLNNRGRNTTRSKTGSLKSQSIISDTQELVIQNSDSENIAFDEVKNIEGHSLNSGGQISAIHSVYFSGTSIYNLLESGGALPKNIIKYITNTHLLNAIKTIDEFYDSIGFSIVSRALYRKSIIDYFDIIKSGFSPDDIKYAVRWTFKNSRTRPESFSLIKHTMHLAMDDLIRELKDVSGEKAIVQEKLNALRKKKSIEEETSPPVSDEDIKNWYDIMDELKSILNEHSFTVFIKPLKVSVVEGNKVVLKAPSDSISWIKDHFWERIQDAYREKVNKDIIVEIR